MHDLFLAVQQSVNLRDVRFVRRCRNDRMYQTRVDISTDMRLHAEVPLVALLRLVHLRVALTAGVLRLRRRINDGRIHRRAALDHQTLADMVVVHTRQGVINDVMFFDQVPKIQDRRLVRDRRLRRQPCELPQRRHV